MDNIEQAFHLIHENIQAIPNDYCDWKYEDRDGSIVSKTLNGSYRPLFVFIQDKQLRDVLAELRMCLDYHTSLFKLFKPGLVFRWQHNIAIHQIIAAIYEGIFWDILQSWPEVNNDFRFANAVVKKILKGKPGLSELTGIVFEAGLISEETKEYLVELNNIRNFIHPNKLKGATYETAPLLKAPPDGSIDELDHFIGEMNKNYGLAS